MPEQTFNEEEVAALFKRAAEMQSEEIRDPAAVGPGLKMNELLAIATEAGLDLEHVRKAAKERNTSSQPSRRTLARVRGSEISTERWISQSVPEAAVEDIVAELRHVYDSAWSEDMGVKPSTTQIIGRSVECKRRDLWGIETRVLLQPRGDSFRLRVSIPTPLSTGGTEKSMAAMAALIVGFVAAPAAGSYLIGLAAGIATFFALLPLLRKWSERWVDKKQREVDALADSLVDQVVQLVGGDDPELNPTQQQHAELRPSSGLETTEEEESGAEQAGSVGRQRIT